jgi:hypothetical protein
MSCSFRRLPLVLALVALIVAAVGCGPEDPVEQLRVTRANYQVELLNWALRGAAEEGAAPTAIFSVRVTRQTNILSLPCLTVDVTFGGGETGEEPVGKKTVVLELEGIEEAGGTLEITKMVEAPGAEVSAIAVDPTPATTAEELRELCEAQAVPEFSQ